MLHVIDVLKTSVSPDRAHVRTVLAAVFNRDVNDGLTEELSGLEAVVILAAKMLLDMGHKSGHVQAIFRLNKERLLGKRLDSKIPVILSICDNRYALVFGDVNDYVPAYNYITGKQSSPQSVPLLQMSINLSKLLEMVQAAAAGQESRSPEAGS